MEKSRIDIELATLVSAPHRELGGEKERYSLSTSLTEAFGFKDLSVHHEILPPGRRSAYPHAHTQREEMLFVLRGRVRAREGSHAYDLGAGESFGFRPFPPVESAHAIAAHTHTIENPFSEPAEYLLIASNPAEDRVLYADSALNRSPTRSSSS